MLSYVWLEESVSWKFKIPQKFGGKVWRVSPQAVGWNCSWSLIIHTFQKPASISQMMMGQYWLGKTKALWLTQNTFKKLLQNLKKKRLMEFSAEWVTDWLTNTSHKCNSKAVDFIVLLLSSFVFHSSLLRVNLVVAHDGFLCISEIVCIFHSSYFDYRGDFQAVLDSYCHETGLKTDDNKV